MSNYVLLLVQSNAECSTSHVPKLKPSSESETVSEDSFASSADDFQSIAECQRDCVVQVDNLNEEYLSHLPQTDQNQATDKGVLWAK